MSVYLCGPRQEKENWKKESPKKKKFPSGLQSEFFCPGNWRPKLGLCKSAL